MFYFDNFLVFDANKAVCHLILVFFCDIRLTGLLIFMFKFNVGFRQLMYDTYIWHLIFVFRTDIDVIVVACDSDNYVSFFNMFSIF